MKGFTLIELMIVMLIFSIILGAVFAVMTMGRTSWYTGNTQVEVQQETRKGMDWMVRELRPAKLISISANTIEFKVPIDEDIIDTTIDDDVLDINGNIEWGANDGTNDRLNWTIEYSLSNKQILRKAFNNADPAVEQTNLRKVLANNVTALSFNSVSSSIISIGITAQKDTIQGRTMQSTLHSQVRLRN